MSMYRDGGDDNYCGGCGDGGDGGKERNGVVRLTDAPSEFCLLNTTPAFAYDHRSCYLPGHCQSVPAHSSCISSVTSQECIPRAVGEDPRSRGGSTYT